MSALTITSGRLYQYKGEHGLDVTRKSGRDGLVWAPSAELVFPAIEAFKRAPDEETKTRLVETFRAAYIKEMKASYTRNLNAWLALLHRADALVSILGRYILPRVCAKHGIFCTYRTE